MVVPVLGNAKRWKHSNMAALAVFQYLAFMVFTMLCGLSVAKQDYSMAVVMGLVAMSFAINSAASMICAAIKERDKKI